MTTTTTMNSYRAENPDPPRAAPCIRLWSRVFAFGIRDAVAEQLGEEHHDPSALSWLSDNDSSDIGSAIWIAEMLNLHLPAVRLFVLSATPDDLKNLRRKAKI